MNRRPKEVSRARAVHRPEPEHRFALPARLDANRLTGCSDVAYLGEFLPAAEAVAAFETILVGARWRQEQLRVFGRSVAAPRLTDWGGAPGVCYRYSGTDHVCDGWRPEIEVLRSRIEALLDWTFDFVLMNRYRDGNDAMGWHADDEPELGRWPVIATLSLGAPRRFRMRPIGAAARHGRAVDVELAPGSLLVMFGESQHAWRHSLPRIAASRAAGVGERISLTFRRVRAEAR